MMKFCFPNPFDEDFDTEGYVTSSNRFESEYTDNQESYNLFK